MPSPSDCTAVRGLATAGDLAEIVRRYKATGRPRLREQLESFRAEPTLRAALLRAGHARRPDGKRYRHQQRISAGTLRAATRRLLVAPVAAARTFDDLHRIVAEAIGAIRGIGELMIYDTALRIGAKLGLRPDRVYLHRGTRDGARALGLDWRLPSLPVSAFPPELRTLAPHEIEDCLCIYKSELKTKRESHVSRARTARRPVTAVRCG